MNNQIELKIVEDSNNENLFYDINGICETEDSIFWTLVPNEVFHLWGLGSKTFEYDDFIFVKSV